MYEEAAPYYAQLRGNASALCSALSRAGYDVAQLWGGVPSEQALARMGTDAASVLAGVVTADVAAAQPAAASAAAALRDSIAAVSSVDALLHGSATALLAAAAVQVICSPALCTTSCQICRRWSARGLDESLTVDCNCLLVSRTPAHADMWNV